MAFFILIYFILFGSFFHVFFIIISFSIVLPYIHEQINASMHTYSIHMSANPNSTLNLNLIVTDCYMYLFWCKSVQTMGLMEEALVQADLFLGVMCE